MLITGQNILDKNLLKNANPLAIKGSSYYLRIRSIIPAGHDLENTEHGGGKDSHSLAPGGLAWVVSEECFQIEDYSVTALVTLKSSFTKKGLLLLDVGLVDAGYVGPIGTVVINFSKNHILLTKGDEFFRVIFMQHDEVDKDHQRLKESHSPEDYIQNRKKEIVRDFPKTFLALEIIEKRILESLSNDRVLKHVTDELFDRFALLILKKYWWAIIAIILASPLLTSSVDTFWVKIGSWMTE